MAINSEARIAKEALQRVLYKCFNQSIAPDITNLMKGFNFIIQRIVKYDLDEYINEVFCNIWGPRFPSVTRQMGLTGWTIDRVSEWISSLSFLGPSISRKIEEECIDGDCFMALTDKEWLTIFGLNYSAYYLVETIMLGWRMKDIAFDLPDLSEFTYPVGALLGASVDLSTIDRQVAQRLVSIDNMCSESGVGYIYGQLVVLGYKEYRVVDQSWCPFGAANQKFILKRRRVPNGVTAVLERDKTKSVEADYDPIFDNKKKIVFTLDAAQELIVRRRRMLWSTTQEKDMFKGEGCACASTIELPYEIDPTRDSFQIGRFLSSANDLNVSGMLHLDDSGSCTGPVSRFACRVQCERLPPFRSFLFAGGFNTSTKELIVSRTILRNKTKANTNEDSDSTSTSMVDGFTTFGVKIWQPELREWLEVSVLGNTYVPRKNTKGPIGPERVTPLGNMLTDGSMIDVCGITFTFQNPVHMATTAQVDPQTVIGDLNALKPLCPVLFNQIKFTFVDTKQRFMRSLRHEASELPADLSVMFPGTSTIHIPPTDYSDVNEENRSYVFPVCGHVYGYHKSLENRPCPLCRKPGPFVPIAFTFEPSICSRKPTHVFNPCGHVASKATCEYWASTPVYSRNISQPSLCFACPFCATELAGPPPLQVSRWALTASSSSSNLGGDDSVEGDFSRGEAISLSLGGRSRAPSLPSVASTAPAVASSRHAPNDQGNAYSKLILQTETGKAWESSSDEEEMIGAIASGSSSSSSSKMVASIERWAAPSKFSLSSLEAVMESQKKLFLRERLHLSNPKGKRDVQEGMDFKLLNDVVTHPKYPKYLPGYNVFGIKN